MLGDLFRAFLITSIAGSALAVIITFLRPVTRRVFGYSWHYYIWLAVLIVMVLPVRVNVGQNDGDIPVVRHQGISEQGAEAADIFQTEAELAPPEAPTTTDLIILLVNSRLDYLSIIWLLGMEMFFAINIIGYARFVRRVHKNSVVADCPQIRNYTDRKIIVRKGGELSSPFMLGVFRPTLILPERELTAEQLRNILSHEMTHFRRKDILYKWFAVIVRCIHWFNPMVYFVVRQINRECEISCDLSVTRRMNREEQMSYVDTILSLVSEDRVKSVPMTTQMANGKRALKRRFIMIKNAKQTTKFVSAVSAAVAVAALTTTVFAGGALSNATDPGVDGPTAIYITKDRREEVVADNHFSDEEAAEARAVVEEYYRAGNAKDRQAQLATLKEHYNAPNVKLASDDKSIVTVRGIRYDPNDIGREEYVTYGRGSVTNTTLENVIVFRIDYDVSFPEGTTDEERGAWQSEYRNWKMILIRDGKDGKWLIDDMGY